MANEPEVKTHEAEKHEREKTDMGVVQPRE